MTTVTTDPAQPTPAGYEGEPREPTPPDVPGYRLGRRLGRGSSGSVWSAVRHRDQAVVAVKVVSLHSSVEVAQATRELAVLGRLEVDGLVGFHEVLGLAGEPPAVAIVMDHVAGGTLAAAVAARDHLSVGESVTVLVPVARTLAGLHAVGVVHGDVSPANVLLESSGRPRVSDLGLARLTGEAPSGAFGERLGTPGFVAPEVMRGADPTPASDVYAVGALAWWSVTGAPLQRGYGREPDDTALRGVPESWRIATEFALSPDPQLRPSAMELALAYFDSATCEPLRLVVGADDTSLLTQRLRRPDDAGDGGDDRSPPKRRRPRWRRGPRWLWLVVVGGVLAASALGVVLDRPWDATPVQPRHRSDLAAIEDSPRRDPRGLMQALADRRARAMMAGGAEGLGLLDVPGSEALRTDTTVLTDLRRRGQSYRDVAFVVRRATTLSVQAEGAGASIATIEAVVDTAAYTVVDASGATRHPGGAAAPMRFTLRWQDQRWKVERISAG